MDLYIHSPIHLKAGAYLVKHRNNFTFSLVLAIGLQPKQDFEINKIAVTQGCRAKISKNKKYKFLS
jgi:hypothetical protein